MGRVWVKLKTQTHWVFFPLAGGGSSSCCCCPRLLRLARPTPPSRAVARPPPRRRRPSGGAPAPLRPSSESERGREEVGEWELGAGPAVAQAGDGPQVAGGGPGAMNRERARERV